MKQSRKNRQNLFEKDRQEYLNQFNQLYKDLLANTIGKMLQAELDEFLGYPKYKRSDNPNYRNGSYSKTVNTLYGQIDVEIPRDRLSMFDPKLIPKGEKTLICQPALSQGLQIEYCLRLNSGCIDLSKRFMLLSSLTVCLSM